jgi:hypothetical protein
MEMTAAHILRPALKNILRQHEAIVTTDEAAEALVRGTDAKRRLATIPA